MRCAVQLFEFTQARIPIEYFPGGRFLYLYDLALVCLLAYNNLS
jgi:hypothetical protein